MANWSLTGDLKKGRIAYTVDRSSRFAGHRENLNAVRIRARDAEQKNETQTR